MDEFEYNPETIVGVPVEHQVVVETLTWLGLRLAWKRLSRHRLTGKGLTGHWLPRVARAAGNERRRIPNRLKLLRVKVDYAFVLFLDANDCIELGIGDAVKGEGTVCHFNLLWRRVGQ